MFIEIGSGIKDNNGGKKPFLPLLCDCIFHDSVMAHEELCSPPPERIICLGEEERTGTAISTPVVASAPPSLPSPHLHLSPPRLSAFIPHGRSTLEGKQIDCRQLKTLISRRAGFAPETPIPKINNIKKTEEGEEKKEEGSTSLRQCLTVRGRDWWVVVVVVGKHCRSGTHKHTGRPRRSGRQRTGPFRLSRVH